MKLYTRTGDDGTTGLFGGKRVSKDNQRPEVYGTVDELNALLGHSACCCRFDELADILTRLQNELFVVAAELANPASGSRPAGRGPCIDADGVVELERTIDRISSDLPSLTQFILPGGSELAARLHHARAVCRRAERCAVRLTRDEPLGPHVLAYLNRLSDLLFAMARRANQLEGVEELPWSTR